MDPQEWTGHWWLPGVPDQTVPGVLRFGPNDGLTLSLIGGFESRVLHRHGSGMVERIDESRTWPMIQGVAGNTEITLLDCTPAFSVSYNFGPVDEQRIEPGRALVGVHLNDAEDAVFTGVEVTVENLTLWSAGSVFTVSLGMRDEDTLNGTGKIAATPVDALKATVGDLGAALKHRHTLPHLDDRRNGTVGRMTDTAVLRFDSPDRMPLGLYMGYVKGTQDLISLATHSACGLISQTLILPPEDDDPADRRPALEQRVEYYAKQIVAADPEAETTNPHEVLFTLHNFDFGDLLPRWFETRTRFEATCNMLISLWEVPGGYVEPQVVTAVAAAEAMHRALELPSPIPDAQFKSLKKTLVAAVPEERKQWVAGLLARNEPTLKQRLVDLASRPDSEAMKALLPDPETWAVAAGEARNGIAHTGQTARHSINQAHAIAKVTSAVVVLNLLHEIGLPSERLREVVNDNPDLRHASQLAKNHLTARGQDGGEEP